MAEATTQNKPGVSAVEKAGQAVEERRAGRDAEAARRTDELDNNPAVVGADPYPPFDFMTLDEVQACADEAGAKIPDDTWKSLMITELRAHRSGNLSAARKRPA